MVNYCNSMIALALLFLSPLGRSADEISLANTKTIVFYGDSITQNNLYSRLVEAFIISRFPDQKFRCFNFGWGGDTANAGAKRYGRDVLPMNPDLVFVNFGMNDVKYKQDSSDFTLVEWYLHSETALAKAIKSGGAREVLVTTSTIDSDLHGSDGYNDTLEQFADGLLMLAKQQNTPSVDVFHCMRPLQQRVKAAIPNYNLTQDSIHPNITGALVMAYCVIKRVDAPHVGADIDIRNGKLVSARGSKISNFDYAGKSIKFDLTLPFVPLYIRADARSILPFLPIEDELNHFVLRIGGWNQSSGCSISVDGLVAGGASAAEVDRGIDLAVLDNAAWVRQSQTLFNKLQERFEVHWDWWRNLQTNPDVNQSDPAIIKRIADGKAREEEMEGVLKECAQPRSYHVVLTLDTAPATYPLVVSNGEGSGSYPPGTQIAIAARAAPAGRKFEMWAGDVGNLAGEKNSATTIKMPASAVNVEAVYSDSETEPRALSITPLDITKH